MLTIALDVSTGLGEAAIPYEFSCKEAAMKTSTALCTVPHLAFYFPLEISVILQAISLRFPRRDGVLSRLPPNAALHKRGVF